MTNEEFWKWADSELKARGSSYYRAEQEAGLSNAAISKQARNWSTPTLTACKALAQALDLPLQEVLRQAGHMSPEPTTPYTDIPRLQSFLDKLARLPPESQSRIMDGALYLIELDEAARSADTTSEADILSKPD